MLAIAIGDEKRDRDTPATLRTYFIGGHRVEQIRHSPGHASWACDCADYLRGHPLGGARWCDHAERISATFELDLVLSTPGLVVPKSSF